MSAILWASRNLSQIAEPSADLRDEIRSTLGDIARIFVEEFDDETGVIRFQKYLCCGTEHQPIRDLERCVMVDRQIRFQMHSPPSMTSACPVMKLDMSDARNKMELATSSVVPQRPIGMAFFT